MKRFGNKAYSVEYLAVVLKEDIPALSSALKEKIRFAIENKLTIKPEVFGKPLRRSLKGFRKLRVGDYRIVFIIEKGTVLIIAIKHRSIVYKEVDKRK